MTRWVANPPRRHSALYEQSEGSYVLRSMEESDVEAIAQWRLMTVCSDGSSLRTTGPLSSGKPHPRSYATNSRHLETFVKERKLMSFEEAIYKMTASGRREIKPETTWTNRTRHVRRCERLCPRQHQVRTTPLSILINTRPAWIM